MGRGVIIGHKSRHGDNMPHTQKTAHTQLETQAGLSVAWVPAQDTRTAQCTFVCAHVCVRLDSFCFLANKKQPYRAV